MDKRTGPAPDLQPPDIRPELVDHHQWRAIGAGRFRTGKRDVARVAELEQTQALDAVGSPAEADVPLPFATPPSAALTF